MRHSLRNPLYFWCCCSSVIQKSTSLCIPFHRKISLHLSLRQQNGPMSPTHPTNLVLKISYAPTPIYEYIQPTIDIIKANHLTSRVKHFDVPINYVREKDFLLTIDTVKFKTTIQPADIGTKISTGPLTERHHSYICGARCSESVIHGVSTRKKYVLASKGIS